MNETLFRQYLVDLEIATDEQLDLAVANFPDVTIDQAVIQSGITTESELYERLVDFSGVAPVDLHDVIPSPFACSLLTPHVMQLNHFIPLKCSHETIDIATACPGDWDVLELVRFATDREVIEHLAPRSQIDDVLRDLLGDSSTAKDVDIERAINRKREEVQERTNPEDYLEFSGKDAQNAAVQIVNRLLKNALHRDASDLHIEPFRDRYVVRVRIDGELSALSEISRELGKTVVNRVKVVADMDVAESNRPQDGSFKATTQGADCNVRVSTIPTPDGEKAVLRILNPSRDSVQLTELGMLPEIQDVLERSGRGPQPWTAG